MKKNSVTILTSFFIVSLFFTGGCRSNPKRTETTERTTTTTTTSPRVVDETPSTTTVSPPPTSPYPDTSRSTTDTYRTDRTETRMSTSDRLARNSRADLGASSSGRSR